MFKVTWDAFTNQELHAIRDFDGKKVQSLTNFMTIFKSVTVLVFRVWGNYKIMQTLQVCFREVMFPLLARQRLGLYYNMPVVRLYLSKFYYSVHFGGRIRMFFDCSLLEGNKYTMFYFA